MKEIFQASHHESSTPPPLPFLEAAASLEAASLEAASIEAASREVASTRPPPAPQAIRSHHVSSFRLEMSAQLLSDLESRVAILEQRVFSDWLWFEARLEARLRAVEVLEARLEARLRSVEQLVEEHKVDARLRSVELLEARLESVEHEVDDAINGISTSFRAVDTRLRAVEATLAAES